MAPVKLDIEALADETAITTSNTGGFIDAVTTADVWRVDTARAHLGTRSIRVDKTTGVSSMNQSRDLNTTAAAWRYWVWLDNNAVAGSEHTFARITYSGSTRAIDASLTISGNLRIYDASGSLWVSSALVPTGQWVRIEVYATQSATTGTIQAALYSGDSTTPIDSYSGTSLNTGSSQFSHIFWGFTADTYNQDYWLDGLAYEVGASTFIGPEVTATDHTATPSDALGLTDIAAAAKTTVWPVTRNIQIG